jgi:DNA invertase Pin-like site-specific DNA recombinase
LEGLNVDKIFIDKASGGSTERPALTDLMDWIREGDVVHVHSMDRLARNLQDLRSTVEAINAKGATVKFKKEGLAFTGEASPMQDLLLNMLGAVAEFERSLIRERQREGIELAKERGVYKGRKKALNKAQVKELKDRADAGEAKAALARDFGVTRATVYKYLAS